MKTQAAPPSAKGPLFKEFCRYVMNVSKWGIFSVVIPLMPVAMVAASKLRRSDPLSIGEIFGRGELLLIASGLAAIGIGDALTAKKGIWCVLSGGICAVVAIGAAWMFSDVQRDIAEALKAAPVSAATPVVSSPAFASLLDRVAGQSIGLFIAACAGSFISLLITQYHYD